jgi:hypothetical protein
MRKGKRRERRETEERNLNIERREKLYLKEIRK